MKTSYLKKLIFSLAILMIWQIGFAHIYEPENKKKKKKEVQSEISLRETCDQPTDKWYQNINNVRAILTNGGDVWTENSKGKYIVPLRENAEDEASSLYSGAVWIGGRDAAGNLKLAASDYRNSSEYDFYAGPLDQNGATDKEVCDKWDTHFKVLGAEIDQHLVSYARAKAANEKMDCDSIPDGVKFWPAKGNPFFYEKYKFKLPAFADLAPFYDQNEDDQYDPCDGDYPVIHIQAPAARGECPSGIYADEIFFWVYNDAGGPHRKTQGTPIQMEIQVQAFAWATNDEINDMTFQRYKLINKAISDIKDCYFAWWVDPDLGCYIDDYVGCIPPPVNLMYCYNIDALDGKDGCSCDRGVNTYCDRIPIIGVDYFRGPLGHFNLRYDSLFNSDSLFIGIDTVFVPIAINEDGDTTIELGMTSFIYFIGDGEGSAGMKDPSNATEYYRYLTGYWKDGTPITKGGSGYNLGSNDTAKYVFPDAPNDPNGWSCFSENLPSADRRTVQATGPFVLKPGDVNELIIGVPWVPNQAHPAPALDELLVADELAQALFDNCFELQDGPDAPDIDIVELDQQLILVLSNDTITSNNKYEDYSEVGIKIDRANTDNIEYHFEGYQIYQLYNGDVSGQQLDDFEKARLVYQCDIKNDVSTLYNWRAIQNPSINGGGEKIFIPQKKVSAVNKGLKHVFNVVEDQFAQENKELINHKTYYFMVVAYEHNNWKEFDPKSGEGQREPFFPGRRNVKIYKGVPRPIEYSKLNINPFEGPEITRIEGTGIGASYVNISEKSIDQILKDNFLKDLVYKEGYGPFKVEVFNPFDIKDKEYKLELFDSKMSDAVLDTSAYWKLTDVSNGKVYYSHKKIKEPYQQLILGEGFTVSIDQAVDVATLADPDNGVIGSKLIYGDSEGPQWLAIVGDDLGITLNRFESGEVKTWDITNYIRTAKGERDETRDPNKAFNKKMKEAPFAPFILSEFAPSTTEMYISPSARNYMSTLRTNSCFANNKNCLNKLNNVDIVFTADKSKWSRCVVIETSYNSLYDKVVEGVDGVLKPEGNSVQFQLRGGQSVGKEDANGDGLADPDGDGTGMGWFPGYAIDVETGERLNIFFGEASTYGGTEAVDTLFTGKKGAGRDMMFNPTEDAYIGFPGNIEVNEINPWNWTFGGLHMVYVTNTRYDACSKLRDYFKGDKYSVVRPGLETITWAAPVMISPSDTLNRLKSYKDGLIPNTATVQLRVNNPYQVPDAEYLKAERKGYGTYLFNFKGKSPEDYTALEKENPLDKVNVVPNPYYAYSSYETSQFGKQVKITNLPGKCTVTIYSIDGKFIKQFKRDERGIDYRVQGRTNPAISKGQIYPDLIWDLENHKGIPVASGVYLIHIASDEVKAERTIKWFGINREFDPTGL
ncbi:MAG: hypothetical protein IPH57_07535 [Saprospiraceae bacterium]|nr:hypothetical protein [Saprospiraceae bacterium]